MRFLCLHGNGTNSNIMEIQTAPLRYELEDGHEFEFLEAVIPTPMSEGIERISSPDHLFYAFYNPEDLSTFRDTIEQLHKYISAEGPFDAVMGFSGGAVLAAAYIMQEEQSQGVSSFQCAIFFSSAASVVELTYLGLLDDHGDVQRNAIIRIPTVHIWGANDRTAPSGGADLSKLCDPTQRLTMVHNGAHEFPRGDYLTQAVHCIRRAVHAATT